MKVIRLGDVGTGCPFPSPKIPFPNLQFISPKSGQLNHDRHALAKTRRFNPSEMRQPRSANHCGVSGATSLFCARSTGIYLYIAPATPGDMPQRHQKKRLTSKKPASTSRNKALTSHPKAEKPQPVTGNSTCLPGLLSESPVHPTDHRGAVVALLVHSASHSWPFKERLSQCSPILPPTSILSSPPTPA